jgi:hypothetical protein
MEAAEQKEFSDFESLASYLKAAGGLSGIVAIDGLPNTGKTPLGKFLSRELELAHSDLDKFLDCEKGYFLDAIRLPEVRKCIDHANGNLIISGCCILEILDRLKITPGLRIYIKRFAPSGIWHGASYAYGELLQKEMSKDAQKPARNLDEEVDQYHSKWRPDRSAQLIVNLPEENDPKKRDKTITCRRSK